MLLQLDSPVAKRSSHSEATHKTGESYPPVKKQEKTHSDDSKVEKCAACHEPAYGFMVGRSSSE